MTSSDTHSPTDTLDVTIEPLAAEHFDAVVQWLEPRETHRFLVSAWRGGKITTRHLAVAARNQTSLLYLIRQGLEPCGLVGLSDIDRDDACGMVWYLVGRRDLSGRGIATKAVDLICRVGFGQLGLRCIYAWVMEPNVGSIRVLEKNDFREFGRMRQAATCDGHAVDRVYFDRIAPQQ